VSLRPTTSRFIPYEAETADELAIARLHLYAYNTAATFVRPGTRVLDIGFGEGYGSEILTEAGAVYRGIETDPDMVEHAKARYGGDFDVYDGVSIPASDGEFDLILSLQVIAFFDDPVPWLRDIRRVLDPQGSAMITTPNRIHRLYEGQRPWNPHHAHEYVAAELREVLAKAFSDVTVYGIAAADPIDSAVKARGNRARRLSRLDPLGIRYRLPDSLNARVRRVLRHTAQPPFDREEFTLDRIWHDEESAETGLDLLAVVRP
jgi:SAM-dependent methyltransferase